MNESEFETFVTSYLEKIFEQVEEMYDDDLEDLEFNDGILNIKLEDGRTFLLNRHLPNQEIWMSSPLSSGTHYKYQDAEKKWICIRTQNELESLLFNELKSVL